jgi:xanthine dehydrogenase accessory factor
MAKVWGRIRETLAQHGNAALLSVIDTAGSVPRESGARIVLQPNGGFFGTIGGGRLEYEAIAEARELLASGRGKALFRDWPLGPNLGQCCGGMVRTLTETFDTSDLATVRRLEDAEAAGEFETESRIDSSGRIVRVVVEETRERAPGQGGPFDKAAFREHFGEPVTPVLLFGAGHVGRAVVLALAPLPFAVRWIDGRAGEFPQHIPQNVVPVCTAAFGRELAGAPNDALVVVMTHSHPLDFDITAEALRRECHPFVGLIGSETKRARFASFARQIGIADSQIDRLVCPIGIGPIKGKEPAVIAAALAAQLLMAREQVQAPQASPATQPA